MEYFLLTISNDVKDTIKPELLDISGPMISYDDLPELTVGYFDEKQGEITDLLKWPVFMVKQEIAELLILYEQELSHKAIQLFTKGDKPRGVLYYAVKPEVCDCLHPYVAVNPNGTANEIILDRRRIPQKNIFSIGGLIDMKIVVSLRVAESLLRRSLYGIGLEKIRIE